MSLKIECPSKWNVAQIWEWRGMEWNVTMNRITPNMKCRSKWNVTQSGMTLKIKKLLKIECHSKWNVI